jgi:WD40 repeat protein
LESLTFGHQKEIKAIIMTRDGNTLYSASLDKTISAWNLFTRKKLYQIEAHTEGVTSLALSKDEKTLYSGSQDSTMAIWDAKSGALIKRSSRTNQWNHAVLIALTPKEDALYVGSTDSSLRLWNIDRNWVGTLP